MEDGPLLEHENYDELECKVAELEQSIDELTAFMMAVCLSNQEHRIFISDKTIAETERYFLQATEDKVKHGWNLEAFDVKTLDDRPE